MPRKTKRRKVEGKGREVLVVDPKTDVVTENGKDVIPDIRRDWWNLPDKVVLSSIGLGAGVTDLALLTAKHLCKRIADPKTPKEVKDHIALTMAPRFTAELRGKLPNKGGNDRSDGLADIMGGYRLA